MAASTTLFADAFSEDPWWWGDAPPVAYDAHPPTGSDVVVVGGGYAGLSCATELALAGRSVTVLDIRRIGEGASGRNAGLVSGRAGISKMIDLEAYVGPDRAAAILNEADEAYVHFQQSSTSRTRSVPGPRPFRRCPFEGGLPQAREEVRGVPRQWRGFRGGTDPARRRRPIRHHRRLPAGWRRARPVWLTRNVRRRPPSPSRAAGCRSTRASG